MRNAQQRAHARDCLHVYAHCRGPATFDPRSLSCEQPRIWQQALRVRAVLASALLGEASTPSSHKSYDELRELEIAVGSLALVQRALQPLTTNPLKGSIAARELRDASLKLHAAICALRSLDPDLPLTPQQWMWHVEGPSSNSGDSDRITQVWHQPRGARSGEVGGSRW